MKGILIVAACIGVLFGAVTAGMGEETAAKSAPVLSTAGSIRDALLTIEPGRKIEVTHPLGFRETIYGAYVKMSRGEPAVRPGPCIGQDNEHVFKELLDISDREFRRLVAAQIIY